MEKTAIAAELTALSFEPVAAKLRFRTKEGAQEFLIDDKIAHDLAHMFSPWWPVQLRFPELRQAAS